MNSLSPSRPAGLTEALAAFVHGCVSLEGARGDARRVDGSIIGTGESDFTKGNQAYALRLGNKSFQLLDVPGIEGDEQKYVEFVRRAVAKAHLVIYVNGTNKKPEATTADKIARYLQHGTQVLPLINMRGNADSYDEPEFRQVLEDKAAINGLAQTEAVLRDKLREDVLLPGACVQGLLAFSSLAFEPTTGLSTVSTAREHDLGRQQGNYLKVFGSAGAMRSFSAISTVEKAIRARVQTFGADIVQSNKRKTIDLIADNMVVLEEALEHHRGFMAKQHPAFDSCRFALREALASFERELTISRARLVNGWFDTLCDEADVAVAKHFGNQDQITATIQQSFANGQTGVGVEGRKLLDTLAVRLNDDIHEALTRLHADIQRVTKQTRVANRPDAAVSVAYEVGSLEMDIGAKAWGKAAFSIGSYAVTGGTIGSTFAPGIGTAIGAGIGAVVGLAMSALDLLLGQSRRIRKAQGQMRTYLETLRDKALGQMVTTAPGLLAPIAAEVDAVRAREVDSLHAQMMQPKLIIERQITRLRATLQKLQEARHGEL